MRKFFPYLFMFLNACFCDTEKLYSQQLKVAVFDIDSMVYALPEYATVDSLMEIYEDTLKTNYQVLLDEYKKLDSIFRHTGDYKSEKYVEFLDSIGERSKQIQISLVYWQPMIEQKKKDRRRTFAEPLYQRVNAALKKVTNEKKYDLILKPKDVEFGSIVDNLFMAVARELNLSSLPAILLQIPNKILPH